MSQLRFFTAGESHGQGLVGIIEGMPADFGLSSNDLLKDLKRRQGGHGRGGRMKIESDRAEILSGVRKGKTLGSPIALVIENRDWENWKEVMSSEPGKSSVDMKVVTKPRPGHADLAGALKYGHRDMRNVLERSSARETAMRVALGAVAKRLLEEFGITVGSYVVQIGNVQSSGFLPQAGRRGEKVQSSESELKRLFKKAEKSPIRCPDGQASAKMVKLIDKAITEGNSLGGVFEVFAAGIPVGLGSYVHWDRKLDARLAMAVMSIQAIKGVEIGLGFGMAERSGSEVMDEIFYGRSGFSRRTNNAGGIEGGISNGMPIVVRAAMKPIPTLRQPLRSVEIRTKKPFRAAYERSDTCAVPAAAVVAEAMTALVLADAFLEKFGGDSREEILRNFRSYTAAVARF